MAELDTKPQPESQPETVQTQETEQNLKYLDFVQIAALQVLLCFATFYNYAKENSGPLKPGVQTVEDNVKTVITPVYEKFRDVPLELLKFVDRKVDSSVNELGRHVPPLVKSASFQAYTAAQKAPEVARSVASEVQRVGLVDTATDLAKTVYTKSEPTAKQLYAKYEPVAEHYAVTGWQKLNQLPVFPQVAHVVVPTAAYWADKYNQTVASTAKSGYTVSLYLPIVPLERIAKVFGGETTETQNAVPVSDDGVAAQ